ncbi:MAG: hypothetical protein WKG00_40665 [Polyangiaceae bacterium]
MRVADQRDRSARRLQTHGGQGSIDAPVERLEVARPLAPHAVVAARLVALQAEHVGTLHRRPLERLHVPLAVPAHASHEDHRARIGPARAQQENRQVVGYGMLRNLDARRRWLGRRARRGRASRGGGVVLARCRCGA